MQNDVAGAQARHADILRRGLKGTATGLAVFAALGTVTAVWANPLFVRMTPVGPWEFGATVLTALLAGLTSALWISGCRLRASGTGGVASFLGIACPTCNKILMLIFGGPALLAWFDPIRPLFAAAGVIVMGFAAGSAWSTFRDARFAEAAAPATIVDAKGGPQ